MINKRYNMYNNKNDNDKNSENSFNKEGRIFDAKFAALKRMAEAPILSESFTVNEKGNRIYFDKMAQARRDFSVNTATPLKADAVRRYEDFLIKNGKKTDNTGYFDFGSSGNNSKSNSNSNNNTVTASKPNTVRDLDQPLTVKLAAAANSPINQKQQQQGTSVNMTQEQDINNYTDDGILVQHILDDLRQNVLSTGQEYDSSSLADIIRKRYPGATPAIIKSVIDTIFNDQGVKSGVAGTFPEFKLLISARNPTFGGTPQPTQKPQQLQQNQQRQPQQPPNNNQSLSRLPPELEQKINLLSDQDKQLLQQTAVSVVNDMLPQIQDPVDSQELENQIITKYNIVWL